MKSKYSGLLLPPLNEDRERKPLSTGSIKETKLMYSDSEGPYTPRREVHSCDSTGEEEMSPYKSIVINQIEKKKEYNKKYYNNRIKPRKQQEKEYQTSLEDEIKDLRRENDSLRKKLEDARQRIYELMNCHISVSQV